jgi:lipopolysaccharide transport system ATP-binding protein
MSEIAIKVEGMGKRYRVPQRADSVEPDTVAGAIYSGVRRILTGQGSSKREEFWALRDASFEVGHGEVLGMVGANGAGKSTLLKLLSRVTEPTEGRATLYGRVGALLEVGTGFHPDLSGRDNIYLNGTILGMTRREIDGRFDSIVEFSGVERFLDMQVKHYSSGMYVRLAFSIAAHLEPDILLVDEVLSVGDQAFQEKCMGRIREITQAGRTVVFVSHNMSSVASLCTRGLLIEKGGITFDGPINEAIETYLAGRARLDGGGTMLEGAERDGSGEVRFRSVHIANDEGGPTLYPDREAEFKLTFEAKTPVPGHQLNLGLGINTYLGERLITLYTRFDPNQELKSIEVSDGTEVICRVPELPLRPGRYFLTLYLDQTGDLLDRVQNQVEFTVTPSDYFGTGQLPSESQGPFMLRHTWQATERQPAVLPMDVSVRR